MTARDEEAYGIALVGSNKRVDNVPPSGLRRALAPGTSVRVLRSTGWWASGTVVDAPEDEEDCVELGAVHSSLQDLQIVDDLPLGDQFLSASGLAHARKVQSLLAFGGDAQDEPPPVLEVLVDVDYELGADLPTKEDVSSVAMDGTTREELPPLEDHWLDVKVSVLGELAEKFPAIQVPLFLVQRKRRQ